MQAGPKGVSASAGHSWELHVIAAVQMRTTLVTVVRKLYGGQLYTGILMRNPRGEGQVSGELKVSSEWAVN
jgi:hypothetical protein